MKEKKRFPGFDPDFTAKGVQVLHPPHLPRQPNGIDCGLYAMEFSERTMKRFISDPTFHKSTPYDPSLTKYHYFGTLKLVILVTPVPFGLGF